MRLHGHLVEVDWDGSLLRARGTNAEGRALLAVDDDQGSLQLAVEDIDLVGFFDAPLRVGGVLIVVGTDGIEHRMHFRRPDREGFERLAAELDAAVSAAREGRPEVVDLTDTTPQPAGTDESLVG